MKVVHLVLADCHITVTHVLLIFLIQNLIHFYMIQHFAINVEIALFLLKMEKSVMMETIWLVMDVHLTVKLNKIGFALLPILLCLDLVTVLSYVSMVLMSIM
jgi:hypothetical protein